MPIQLNQKNLAQIKLPAPRYDRRRVGRGIMHIGVGGFHRAHQAVYAEDLFHLGEDLQWGLCGVGLLQQDDRMNDVMRRQDCLYTLVERGNDGDRARIVGSIVEFLFAPANREAVLEKMASPETKIVSMTITEGGYYLISGGGEFDHRHADIAHDVAQPHEPACSFGYLLEALDRRRRRGLGPFTVMSCDNIQGNGHVARKVILAMAEMREPALARWIADHGVFPNSMVDRITPATGDEHRALVREKYEVDDDWPVMTELFKQWVIEDHFAEGRPGWEKAGAQMTHDVLPYEKMKLRLLNGAHQALCYIGMLFGYEFAHQTMEDRDIRRLVELMMEEATPVLSPVPGVNLDEYKGTLIERFANPAIRDQLSRIGIYGSSGMPKFVLPTIQEQLDRGGPIEMLSFTAACWFRYLNGRSERGDEIIMKDPMAAKLRELARAGGKDPERLLAVREIFSEQLANSPRFVNRVKEILLDFYSLGARETLLKIVET
jgi:mannitol 2-dehydrogenase